MSRTYRRKKATHVKVLFYDYTSWMSERVYPWEDEGSYCSVRVPLQKGTKEYKEALARFKSDAFDCSFKEPGPGWFRNLYVDRPYRRMAKNELRKFMLDEEYCVMIDSMPPLPYWT